MTGERYVTCNSCWLQYSFEVPTDLQYCKDTIAELGALWTVVTPVMSVC